MTNYFMIRPDYIKNSGYEIDYTSKDGDSLELRVGSFRSREAHNNGIEKFKGAVLYVNGQIEDFYHDKGIEILLKNEKKIKSIESFAKQKVSSEDFKRIISRLSTRPNQIYPYSELKYISDKTLFLRNSGFVIKYTTCDNDKIKLYVGEFSEKAIKTASGHRPINHSTLGFKIIRNKFFGAVLLLNSEEAEKYRGEITMSNLTVEKKRLIRLAKSRVDYDEFVQNLLEIENDCQEQILLENEDINPISIIERF